MKQLTEEEPKEVANILASVSGASNKLRNLLNLDEEHSDDLMQGAFEPQRNSYSDTSQPILSTR